jgi:hypothetical protein
MSTEIEMIYSRLVAAEKLRSGSAYERLAAIVFHILNERTTVQDLRLRGQSQVLHQIDVTVEGPQGRQHILVECKDYGKPVGLPAIRAFWGAVDDLKPDEAYMVTTARFTNPAQKYAAAKGITLAVLRPPQEGDWEGIVNTIRVEIKMMVPLDDAALQWLVDPSTPDAVAAGGNGLVRTEALQLVDESGAASPAQSIIERVLAPPLGFEGEWSGAHKFDEPTWLSQDGQPPIRTDGFRYRQHWGAMHGEVVSGDGLEGLVAELVLKTADGSIHRMFSNRELEHWTFDANGKVVPDP